MNSKALISKVLNGDTLNVQETELVFDSIFKGEVSEIELAGILVAMKIRKEKVDEITGAVLSMRRFVKALPIDSPDIFDNCGTGGDESLSFNVSSAVAIILNTMGVSVVKHGNRSVSSKSGSADFLEALGIPIGLVDDEAVNYFNQNKFIFMFAPNYHPAMKYAVPVRKTLGIRTLFNFIGPLTNPAFPKKQMIGIFHPYLLKDYAQVVSKLHFERVLVYSAKNGMDEVSPVEQTVVYEGNKDVITDFIIDPENFISPSEANAIKGNLGPKENVELFYDTLRSKEPTPLGKMLALNTALGYYALGQEKDFSKGFAKAIEAIHSGMVEQRIEVLKAS